MSSMRFEETRPGQDTCHQCYVRADKCRHCACTCMDVCVLPNLGPNESGTITLEHYITSRYDTCRDTDYIDFIRGHTEKAAIMFLCS